MLYAFTILSWNNKSDEQFILEASDLLNAHMKAIDWVEKLEAGLDTIATRSPESRKTTITSLELLQDADMATDEVITKYVDDIKRCIAFNKRMGCEED